MKKYLFVLGFLGLFSSTANANEMFFKPYVGIDAGFSGVAFSKKSSKDYFEDSYAFGDVNVGAKLHKNFGVEAFYQKSTEEEKKIVGLFKTKAKYEAYGVDVLGYFPVAADNRYEIIGAFGLAQYEYKYKAEILGTNLNSSENGLGYRFGAGVQYNFHEHFGVRAMARYAILDVEGVDGIFDLSLGLQYKF